MLERYLLVGLVGWFSNKFQEFYKVCSTSKEISAPWRFWLPLVLTRLGWHWRMPRMRWNKSLFSNNISRVYSDISKLSRRANASYGNMIYVGLWRSRNIYQFCHFKESVLKFVWDEKSSGKTGRFCTRTDLTLVHQTDLQIRSSYLPPLPHLWWYFWLLLFSFLQTPALHHHWW